MKVTEAFRHGKLYCNDCNWSFRWYSITLILFAFPAAWIHEFKHRVGWIK